MSKVWCQAVNMVYYDEGGATKTARPGDWCQLGRQQARDELTRGNVKILKPATLQSVQDLTDCSILTAGVVYDAARSQLGIRYPGLPIKTFDSFPDQPGRFLIWNMGAKLRNELILVGFGLLQKWQIACPLLSYDLLAESVGTEVERAETQTTCHDLRIPLYDTRIIFARQCEEARRLFELWDGSQLGFVRALYQARPIINALPPSWVME